MVLGYLMPRNWYRWIPPLNFHSSYVDDIRIVKYESNCTDAFHKCTLGLEKQNVKVVVSLQTMHTHMEYRVTPSDFWRGLWMLFFVHKLKPRTNLTLPNFEVSPRQGGALTCSMPFPNIHFTRVLECENNPSISISSRDIFYCTRLEKKNSVLIS